MNSFLLSFEIDEDSGVLKIHGDEQGLRNLCETVNKLLLNTKEGHFNHDHLMTPDWGGYELSAENMGGNIINHVKIYCWRGKIGG
jgi:hypothetical protein